MTRPLLILVLLLFAALTATAVATQGVLEVFRLHASNLWGVQVIADLVIALGLFITWMVGDARRHGRHAWPFVIAVLTLGSIGALLYLVTAPRTGVRDA